MPKNSELFAYLLKLRRKRLFCGKEIEEDEVLFTYKDIGEAIQKLVDNLYQHEFTKDPYASVAAKHVNFILKQTDEYGKPQDRILISSLYFSLESFDLEESCADPAHELFIYSVLLKRPLMAEIFLKEGKNPTMHYLMASKIFKAFSLQFEDESEKFSMLAKNFETNAVKIIKMANDSNSDYAKMLLMRQVPEFGRTNCLQMAKVAYNINFLSNSCVQELLENIWYKKISRDFSFLYVSCYFVVSISKNGAI